jgi:DNA-binding transcriptional ArsR family regulator
VGDSGENRVSISQAKTEEPGREPDGRAEGGVGTLQHRSATTDDDADDVNRVYDVLSNRRRRQILYLLDEVEDNAAEVPELASTIAAWEEDIDDPHAVTYDDRKSVQTAVYQHHAPKMEAAGLVDFDKRACRLELTADVDALLDRTPEREPATEEWERPAVSVSAVALATTVSHFAAPTLVGANVALAVLVVCACALVALALDPRVQTES